MDKTHTEAVPPDGGLACLVMLSRLHGIAADYAAMRHRFGPGERPLRAEDLLRAARAAGLKSRLVAEAALDELPVPAMVETRAGCWWLLARVSSERVLLQDPGDTRPRILSRADFADAWSGRALLATRRAGGADDAPGFGLGWFVAAARPYRALFAEVLLASAVIQVLSLLTPLFFQVVVDKVLVHKVLSTLQVLVVGLVAVSCFEVVLSGLRTWLLAHTTNRIDVTLGARLFRHLLALPLRYFEARRVGDIVARVRELESLRAFVTGSALTLVIDLGFTLIAFAVMYAYSPLLTGIVALTVPAYLALSLVAAPLLRMQVTERFRLGAENQSFLVESVSGMQTLKAMAMEPPMQRRWDEQLAAYVSASFRVATTATLAAQAAQLISRLMSAAILWFGAAAVIRGELSVGQLIAFNLFANRVSAPALRLFQLWQDFQQARVSLERLGDILDAPREDPSSAPRRSVPALRGGIAFERVSFRYEAGRACALGEFTLSIKAGEVIGIVGRSGSGKSTLARLLQRLYVPEQGRILVDGIDIALLPPDALRRQVGVVPQETFLFNASVHENIALGDPGMPIERVVRAARLAGAHDFICELPQGYDTVLGEHAHILSGGQKQRLAIARALVREPRILVFDEATSALDYESELAVRRNLAGICGGRTVILIAHRLSSLANVDRIVVLDRGRLVEEGTHGQLLAAQGIYARLHALQNVPRVA